MRIDFSTRTLWITLALTLTGGAALAFCGFYLAKADADLFNQSSKVIIARDGPRTILTMANDFSGDVSEFALVVPIPYVFEPEQIQVGDPAIFARIDAYSAPRLVEYYDGDPCQQMMFHDALPSAAAPLEESEVDRNTSANALGVTIEAEFSVGEYDILILGAEESEGLETWLLSNGYNIPNGASEVLTRYIASGMKFFVAQVNLEAFQETGFQQLRPLMMAFETEAFMLPIQLGMVNAAGPQDMVMYLLSPRGRIEVSNYRTVDIPSDVNLPEFVENEFGDVYRAMFQRSYVREGENVVFREYGWDMAWCDPCAAEPLSADELLEAGVHWLGQDANFGAPNVFLTRLHVRYTPERFHEDLLFRVTDDRQNFQGRYILQRPFTGAITCDAGRDYVKGVQQRREHEAQTLANLTGWDIGTIRSQMGSYEPAVSIPPWWQRVFNNLR